ncbi:MULTISPECIES: hypothetical protein [Kitasatospora]|uniref:Membrane protein n=1 Tax=Kitasatospora griseola TaxID=2064 RepID=A0A0D0PLN8_KITGR|nr:MULTISPECIES: hypothetical protein [Kitasatospora]KIQ63454.1 membrane protein [Kitasatospora griseola]PJN22584.1 hypothetical protein CG736_26990 [Kitasatospora sp. CB02891]
MDQKNLFMTGATAWLVRAEYGLGLLVSVVLFFAHIGEVRWLPAVLLFAYIDVIGYLPGALRYHRHPDAPTPKVYYVLYNTMHSMVTQGLVVLAWIWLAGAEWALLVVPIHLFGDRAIFGNFLKPFGLHFEPKAHPAYRRFSSEYLASTGELLPPRALGAR